MFTDSRGKLSKTNHNARQITKKGKKKIDRKSTGGPVVRYGIRFCFITAGTRVVSRYPGVIFKFSRKVSRVSRETGAEKVSTGIYDRRCFSTLLSLKIYFHSTFLVWLRRRASVVRNIIIVVYCRIYGR